MKIVPENINEVQGFQRGKDPKSSIGIGMHRHFPSVREAMKYVADILPEILGTDEIPPNIIRSKVGFINWRYIDRISKYKDEYITWDGSPSPESWNVELFWELQERGFLNESVDFQRGKDPKDALNIGNKEARMIQKIQNIADKFGFERVDIPKEYDSWVWDNEYRTLAIWKLRDDENNNLGEGSRIRISTSVNLVYNSDPYLGDEYQVIGFDSNGNEIAHKYDLEYWLRPFGWREIIGSVDESLEFERGKDPKSSMGVGTECRTFHAGSIRYNRGSTTYLDPEMAKRVLSGDDTLYHKYFISVPGSFGEKGFYMDDLQDPHNPYCYIEYLGEIYPVPGKLRESIDFERGREPYDALRIGKNRFRPYPQMTPDEFREWYVQEIEPYYDKELGFDMVLDNIVNNEVESDEELAEYWRVSGVNPEIIKKIIPYRPYFLDFRYIQKIGH